MREKLFKTLNKIYGYMMTVSFFGGFLPLPFFLLAMIVGGELGESIALFLHKQYYPWIILLGSLAVVVGLIAMYIGKLEGLSIKSVTTDKTDKEEK